MLNEYLKAVDYSNHILELSTKALGHGPSEIIHALDTTAVG